MTSPYTAHNVDAAIVHLERVLSAEGANSLFGQTSGADVCSRSARRAACSAISASG